MALTVVFDPAASRLTGDLLSMLAGWQSWMPQTLTGLTHTDPACWVEPVYGTAMLMPGPLFPDWTTANSGVCTKYDLSDYTGLTDAANWHNVDTDSGGPFVQHIGENTGGLKGFLPEQDANQGMVIEAHMQVLTENLRGYLEWGWSNTGDGTVGVSMRLYLDGKIEVWKDGGLLGTYSVSVKEEMKKEGELGKVADVNGRASGKLQGYVTIMCLPFRDREILVHSSAGGAFSHVFLDLPEQAGNVITLAEKFWFNIPAPFTPQIRISIVDFASSGTLYSWPTAWRNTPPGGDPTYVVYQSLSQAPANLVTPLVQVAAFNPYGLPSPVQFKVDLAIGTGMYVSQTPFLYGVRAYYPRVLTDCAGLAGGAGVDVTGWVIAASMSVGDTAASGCNLKFTLTDPNDVVVTAGVPLVRSMCGREIRISDEAGVFLESVADGPEWTDGYSSEAETVSFSLRDDWKLAEEYVFGDCIPLDGLCLKAAYELIVDTIGSSSVVSAAADAVYIASEGASSGGEWACEIQVGDRAATWLDRLHKAYAGNWAHYINRDGAFCLTSPADMPSASSVTLYRDQADAVAALVTGGMSESDARAVAHRHVYRASHALVLEPECNELWVMGQELRTSRPILVAFRDDASVNPATAPADRPANWLGRLKKYAFGDPSLTTKAACLAVRELLKTKLCQPRGIFDVTCEYQDGLWKGDLITLAGGAADGTDLLCRIKTFQTQFVQTEEGQIWRPTTYVVESGSIVAPLGGHGQTSDAIKASKKAQEKAMQSSSLWDDLARALRHPAAIIDVETA